MLYRDSTVYTSQQKLSTPSLAPVDNLRDQSEEIENALDESTSTYESVEAEEATPVMHNIPNPLETLQHQTSPASTEGNSSIVPSPVRRYPSRKRNVPCSFQYEEIVKKKPK